MNRLFAVALLTVLTTPTWAASRTVTLSVPTMDCPVCPITVKKALTRIPGVSQAEVNFHKRAAVVTYEDGKTSIESLMQATKNAAYPSTLAGSAK